MSSILYIGKDYCHTLEQLQDYFRHISSDQDALYNELLTLQRDGQIAQWLEEGTEQEKALAKRIKSLSTSLTNKEVMAKLVEILTNKNKNFNVNLFSYLELKEVAYALINPREYLLDSLLKVIHNGIVINLQEEQLKKTLLLKLKFKIIKPEKESFNLKAMLSLHRQIIHEETSCLHLNNELSGKERQLDFCIPTHKLQKDVGTYSLEVRSESQVLFSADVSLGIPDVFTLNGVNFKMIKVDGGTFEMGSPKNDPDAFGDEMPQHRVTLGNYFIGETVVTQALWKAVMKNPSFFKGNDDLPVENVSYNDITLFLTKLNVMMEDQLHGMNFALPTEEQWEFAARGGVKSKGYKFSGGNYVNDVAWYDGNSHDCTYPVKKKAPNELGIYGMSGNVWEWCHSYWRSNYDSALAEFLRVIRGGSWHNSAQSCRVAYRSHCVPSTRDSNIGFRLVLQ